MHRLCRLINYSCHYHIILSKNWFPSSFILICHSYIIIIFFSFVSITLTKLNHYRLQSLYEQLEALRKLLSFFYFADTLVQETAKAKWREFLFFLLFFHLKCVVLSESYFMLWLNPHLTKVEIIQTRETLFKRKI